MEVGLHIAWRSSWDQNSPSSCSLSNCLSSTSLLNLNFPRKMVWFHIKLKAKIKILQVPLFLWTITVVFNLCEHLLSESCSNEECLVWKVYYNQEALFISIVLTAVDGDRATSIIRFRVGESCWGISHSQHIQGALRADYSSSLGSEWDLTPLHGLLTPGISLEHFSSDRLKSHLHHDLAIKWAIKHKSRICIAGIYYQMEVICTWLGPSRSWAHKQVTWSSPNT